MFDRILGQYLFETKRITRRQLKKVYLTEAETNVQLGLIAVREGLMTLEQVKEVNRMQRNTDARFGQIAVEMGYIKEHQLERLISLQKSRFLTFVQALVANDICSLNRIKELEEEYRIACGWMISEIATLETEDNERIIPMFLQVGGSYEKDIAAMMIKSYYRLIDNNIGIGLSKSHGAIGFESGHFLHLKGGMSLCGIIGKKKMIETFAAKALNVAIIDEESFGAENIERAADEYLEYSCKLFTSELPGRGNLIEPGETEHIHTPGRIAGKNLITTPIIMDEGIVEIVTSTEPVVITTSQQ